MKELDSMDVTDNKRLVLSVGKFRNDERIDLRQYVKVKDEYIPTRKGINFSMEWIDKFIIMIDKLRDL